MFRRRKSVTLRSSKMINPYRPPEPTRLAPFHKRLRTAVRLAVAEYRRGMRREGLVGQTHWISWFSLGILVLLALLFCTLTLIGLLTTLFQTGV